jgi:c-di-GMP-binding flagellar brake protein YcgR
MSIFDSLLAVFRGAPPQKVRSPRSSPRLMVSVPAKLRATGSGEQPAILEDLSTGGACIRSHLRMRVGDYADLSMSLGVGFKFDVRGRVVYTNPEAHGFQSRYGLRFISLSQDDQNRIATYINDQKYGRQFGVRPFSQESEPA